ncbi:ABC transporter permease [Deinococcus radiopugnans]|uniref:ABC transporter permease n=2 Tax=Deinococcus radiopugnans TaxID=57497 RepID=A0A0A7KGG9_9DEIO|nr:ABC transporter permease [Deinococcus radiopugnans]AIZ45262.1 ABC transporter permease [Deinococcus radiopugnans]MBB6017928.1 ABC-2 type transport system permease protein [Deinococcus radiopugnans ATCC 19172]QLG10584.1 ABC transporter permease [Deinococcus sp. D7000]TNM68986.1 ABC transporter permease [Deinococcus radiopugnans ATCC 19172]
MLTLLLLEFRKLLGSRSAKLALIVTFLLPLVWAFAPRLSALIQVNLISGWQLPAVSIGVTIQYLLPLFIAVTVAETIGSETAQGTLAPLLLRPVDRTRVIASKLIAALVFPFLLIITTVAGSLLAGIPLGFGSFTGGTGLGPGLFVGVGQLSGGEAFGQVLRGAFLAAVVLMPVAALSLLFGVLFLNTAASALATFATLIVMRLLVVLPDALQRILLTSHFGLYVQQGDIGQPLILLLIYTLGFGLMAIYAFDRRDV